MEIQQKIVEIQHISFVEIQHEISYYKVRVSTGGVETRWLGWQFLNGL